VPSNPTGFDCNESANRVQGLANGQAGSFGPLPGVDPTDPLIPLDLVGFSPNTAFSAGRYYFTYSTTTPTLVDNMFKIAEVTITPVPEPSTYALMIAGLGVVGYMARRRKAAVQPNEAAAA
jgi:hypothetical protein